MDPCYTGSIELDVVMRNMDVVVLLVDKIFHFVNIN
jgi:hypothetical protein